MKKTFEFIIAIGIILLFATAGASDLHEIHLPELTTRLAIILGIITVGALGISSLPKKKAVPVKRRIRCKNECMRNAA